MTAAIAEIRASMLVALPVATSLHASVPEPQHVYVPPAHARALKLEHDIVVGGRGVGKSFWSAALRNDSIRLLIGATIAGLPDLVVHTGYDERSQADHFPDQATFAHLLASGAGAYAVWRAVVARWLQPIADPDRRRVPEPWDVTVERVRSEPEEFARLLEAADTTLKRQGKQGLIIFDALDRTSIQWSVMDEIVRDLMRVVLDLRPFRYLHAKVFLREDQFDRRGIATFPDASKILASRVELTWAVSDLHGLLWQYLNNAPGPHGKRLRGFFNDHAGGLALRNESDTWQLPAEARREGEVQRSLFTALAGEHMGRDRRRGNTYSWSVGHLADSRRRTSPRSFLAAIRAAVEDSSNRYPEHGYPLHYESIKRGVQAASEIRVNEMAEDYPWVRILMTPLEGRIVPCLPTDIEGAWADSAQNLDTLGRERLPPEHASEGWRGVRRDLVTLGVFEDMKDGRVNMPDLYRVGFGLGRRGGVKPIPSGGG